MLSQRPPPNFWQPQLKPLNLRLYPLSSTHHPILLSTANDPGNIFSTAQYPTLLHSPLHPVAPGIIVGIRSI